MVRYTSWTRDTFKRAAKRGSKSKMIPYYYRKKYGKKKRKKIKVAYYIINEPKYKLRIPRI